MYAWFFPKWQFEKKYGHKYQWESVILWYDSEENLQQVGVSYTSNRYGYKYEHIKGRNWHQGHERQTFEKGPHGLRQNNDVRGRDYPIVEWSRLPQASRDALNKFSFGSGFELECPFNDANFIRNLAESGPDTWYLSEPYSAEHKRLPG